MLRGEEVYLRSLEKRDINVCWEICTDEKVREYDGGYYILPPREYMLTHFDEFFTAKRKFLSIINKNEVVVGYITYKEYEDSIGVYDIGITIGSRFWSRGYGKDAIKALLEFLFMQKGANRVELEVVAYNNRAINLYKGCGFIIEGKKRKRYFANGKHNDTYIMGILRDEYLEIYKNINEPQL